jgi:hypothetical protein
MAEAAKLVGTTDLQLALPGGQVLRLSGLQVGGLHLDAAGAWLVELTGQGTVAATPAPPAPPTTPPAVKPVTPAPPAPGPAEKPKG